MLTMKKLAIVVAATMALSACGTIQGALEGFKKDVGLSQSTSSAPAGHQGARPTNQVNTNVAPALAMINLGDGHFCPQGAVVEGERVREWDEPGAHPYAGTVPEAIGLFRDVPKEVRTAWWNAFKEGKSTKRASTEGERLCGMFFTVDGVKDTYHRIWPNVRVGAWVDEPGAKNGMQVITVEHGGYAWDLVIPEVCDNVSYVARKVSKSTPASPRNASPSTSTKEVITEPLKGGPKYFLQVRFWEWDSIPHDFQKKVAEIMTYEANETYGEKEDSVSRALGDALVASWQEGDATTVKIPMVAEVEYPGVSDWKKVRAHKSKEPGEEGLVYWSHEEPRAAMAVPDAQFKVRVKPQSDCSVVYPEERANHTLSTRLNPKPGTLSELAQDAASGSEGFNLNVIMDCP